MNFFEAKSYKGALKDRLLERKKVLSSFNFQGFAQACRVQKTYVSRVFNADAHLNEDQVYAACDYLGLNESEKEYVLCLHSIERSQLASRQRYFKKKAESMRRQNNSPTAALQTHALESSVVGVAEYYLDPKMLLVHAFLGVSEYAESVKKIADCLKITESELSHILTKLEQIGIIGVHDGKYEVKQRKLSLPENSPLKGIFRRLMRYKLLDHMSDERLSLGTNYSVVFSADEATAKEIKEEFLAFFKKAQNLVAKAASEQVYQLNFDFERWG